MTADEHKRIFEEWLSRHKGLFFKIVRMYARTRMDQDDLFQEIAVQVWHSIPSFLQAASESTWIYRIGINTAIKWVRKEARHEARASPILQVVEAGPDDERLTWLYEAIHKLDPVDRSIALLLLDGFSYKEMASMLGITESNVGVKINRIKKQLIAQSKKTNDGI